MKRILCGLGLWCAYLFAFAGDADSANFVNTSIAPTDMSMTYLRELFGNVAGALQGTGSDLLGHIFFVFNQGVLVVAAVWLVFTVTNLVLNSGLEGAFNSPQRKGVMILLRIATGLALLVPSPNTGYSAIQTIIMKIVVEGVRLADATWSYSLDYLSNGGVIYSPPSMNKLTLTELGPYMAVQNNQPKGVVMSLYSAEVCMYLSNRYNDIQQKMKGSTNNKKPYRMVDVAPFMQKDGQVYPGQLYFPGYGDQAPFGSSQPLAGAKQYASRCGHVAPTVQAGNHLPLMQYQQSFVALDQLALDLLPLARKQAYAVSMAGGAPPSQGMSAVAGGKLFSDSVLQYINQITPYANYIHSQTQQKAAKFIPNAKDQGWFAAGSFYWNLSNLNDSMTSSEKFSEYVPIPNSGDIGTFPKTLKNAIVIANNSLGGAGEHTLWGAGLNDLKAYTDAQSNPNGQVQAAEVTYPMQSSEYTTDIDSGNIVKNALASVVKQFASMESDPSNRMFYDPLEFVQNLGHSCLDAAGSIWANGMSWSIGVATAMGICAAASPGATIFSAMLSWLTPLWTMASVGMFVAGFMLTFYAPLYPYLLFMFGAIGWLIYVIEAMVAAPLVCFGMTHPEGHDFMGRAEQSMMLALGVFLRPTLMVIGFLIAILLSYIGFSIVNYSFGQVFTASFVSGDMTRQNTAPIDAIWTVVNGNIHNAQDSHFTGHHLSDFLLIPLLMIAYGLIVIEVVNQCFSLIHHLPDMILRWIGMSPQQDQSERFTQAIKSGMTSSAQQGGRAAGEAAGGLARGMGGQVDGAVSSAGKGIARSSNSSEMYPNAGLPPMGE